jgi:hypothetical protein
VSHSTGGAPAVPNESNTSPGESEPLQQRKLERADRASSAAPEATEPQDEDDDLENTVPPMVRMIPSSVRPGVGERVTIAVAIAAGTDVGHVPFHVVFDPRVLRFEYGEEGGFLGSDGRQTAFFASLASDGARVVVGLSRLGRGNGIHGGGVICVLHFTAVAPGNAALGFVSAKVRDSANQIVPAQFIAASVSVG